jgi:hypothetical protein
VRVLGRLTILNSPDGGYRWYMGFILRIGGDQAACRTFRAGAGPIEFLGARRLAAAGLPPSAGLPN